MNDGARFWVPGVGVGIPFAFTAHGTPRSTLGIQHPTLSVHHSTLRTRCSVLSASYSMLRTQGSVLVTRYSLLGTAYRALRTPASALPPVFSALARACWTLTYLSIARPSCRRGVNTRAFRGRAAVRRAVTRRVVCAHPATGRLLRRSRSAPRRDQSGAGEPARTRPGPRNGVRPARLRPPFGCAACRLLEQGRQRDGRQNQHDQKAGRQRSGPWQIADKGECVSMFHASGIQCSG